MTQEEENTLRSFETRVRLLILRYKELEAENQRLSHLVDEKEQALKLIAAENEKLRDEYTNLKLAKMMEISNKELSEAKSKISKLIREVDKCIALLNV